MTEMELASAPKGAVIEWGLGKAKVADRLKGNFAKLRQESARIADQFLVTGLALGTSFGVGYMVTKNPAWAQLGSTGIDTDLAVGATAVVGSLVVGGDTGRYMAAVGIGMLAPWARDMGASMAAPSTEG